MNSYIVFVFFLLSSLVETKIIDLNSSNFDELTLIGTGYEGDWLIKFYAPWCSHCKVMFPVYEEVEVELKGRVNVGQVDCR